MSIEQPPLPCPFVITFAPPTETTITEVAAFKSVLVRNAPAQMIETQCRELITKYTNPVPDWSALYHLYQVIRETRETLLERDLTYIQLYAWHEIHPIWASTALAECVYNYGCWKDIKYFCDYCKTRSSRRDHPFILYAICLLDSRLKQDWAAYQTNNLTEVSYAAKWTPREKSKYGWIYIVLSVGYFGYLSDTVTLKQKERALKKSKMSLRKIISTLNNYLDTTEIKQCKNEWNNITPSRVPIHAAFKYHRAFYRHSVPIHPVRDNTPKYPYSNVKLLADKVNRDYDLDKEVTTEETHKTLMSYEYRQNFDELVSKFFGSSTLQQRHLSIIDLSTLNTQDLNTSIGSSCVECSGVMILMPSGKYQFFSFSTDSICERIKQLSKTIEPSTTSTSTSTSTSTTTETNLRSVSIFMEKCFSDTSMNETERETIKMIVFSRHTSSSLKEIFKNNLFELRLQ